MSLILFFAAVISYLFFLLRFAQQSLLWVRASGGSMPHVFAGRKTPATVYVSTLLDVLFLRRLFSTSKVFWLGSWTFHVSFFFVALRHTRYFFPFLPDCLVFLQPAGVVAGYLMPLSLLYLLILRAGSKKESYVSAYNYFLSGMLFVISSAGVAMRTFFRPDLIDVKYFVFGVLSLRPHPLPDNAAFILHGSLFLLLLPFLPIHLFAAPFAIMDANRRGEGLRYMMHEE